MIGVLVTLAPVGTAALPAFGASVAIDLAVLGAVWFALRPGEPDVRSLAELDATVHAGKPVLVELYSNLCLICMANRQIIRIASGRLGAKCTIVRVEAPTGAGREIADTFRAPHVPSYLLFDARGDLVRTVIPDTVTPLANGYRVTDPRSAAFDRVQRVTPELLVDLVRRAA